MSQPTTQRPGRAFLVYSGLRLLLLVVAYAVLTAIGLDGLLAVGGAVLLSALLSLVLLRRQRDAFTAASMARADERRADKERRRARLDGPAPDGPAPDGPARDDTARDGPAPGGTAQG